MPSVWPPRQCRTCGWKTTSTSTIDFCVKCGDNDGLRPRHFLTRDQPEPVLPNGTEKP